ncbi:MAG: thiolase family protein [Thermodesulfobacteriota bacterium]
MGSAKIIGVGMTKFGRFAERSPEDLAFEAMEKALADANVAFKDIQAMFLSNSGTIYPGIGPKAALMFGRTTIPIVNVEAACSGGGACLRMANMVIGQGEYDLVLAVGVEKQPRGFLAPVISGYEDWQALAGLTQNPMYWAMKARKHMEDYGTTIEQIGMVSVKNHKNGVLNPNAMYQQAMTLEQVLSSRVVCDPLTLYMFCAPNDGSAAVLLCNDKVAKRYSSRVVTLAACAHRISPYPELDVGNYCGFDTKNEPVTTVAAREAYEKAGVGPEDVSFAELQDTDASGEILFTEELLLCRPGEGGKLVSDAVTELDGRLPISTDGGIISKGEPVGASALGQIHEAVVQLRGEAGKRQVKKAKVGLCHVKGALGHSCVTILTV